MSWLVESLSEASAARDPSNPGRHRSRRDQPVHRVLQPVGAHRVAVPGLHGLDHAVALAGDAEHLEVEAPADDRVLDVVHRVGDVVGQVHDLRLEALAAVGRLLAQPLEDRQVVLVDAELVRRPPAGRADRSLQVPPRVLHRGVEAGAREVEPDRATVGGDDLGLEPGEQPQRLGVALEPADPLGQLRQRALAVVPERRVPQVVRQARRVDDVGVAAQRLADLAAHLRDLERVREPRAHEVVRRRPEHLRLGAEPPQRRGVHQPRAVPLERRPLARLRPAR